MRENSVGNNAWSAINGAEWVKMEYQRKVRGVQDKFKAKLAEELVKEDKKPPGAVGNGTVIDVKPTSVEVEPNEIFICVQTFSHKKAIIRMFDNQDPKVVLRERGLQALEFRDATKEEIAAWRKANS